MSGGQGAFFKVKIDGCVFPTIYAAFLEAKRRGFDGTPGGFRSRLRSVGEYTWANLVAPVSEPNRQRTARRAETLAAKKAEMAAVIAALDARKAGVA